MVFWPRSIRGQLILEADEIMLINKGLCRAFKTELFISKSAKNQRNDAHGLNWNKSEPIVYWKNIFSLKISGPLRDLR